MKKIKILLPIVAFLIGSSYFYWKSKEPSLNKDIYFFNNKGYSISTDKEITGYTLTEELRGKVYREYKDGILQSEKVIDKDSKLISNKKFNSLGLLSGKAYKLIDKKTYEFMYKNNILNGTSEIENSKINFTDGSINGKNLIFENSDANKKQQINYKNGVPDFINLKLPSTEYPKKILVNETSLPERYSGGAIYIRPAEIVLVQYEDGILQRKRAYENEDFYYGTLGLKTRDITYFKTGQTKQELMYEGGVLKTLRTFNEKGELDGISYDSNLYSNEFEIREYQDNVLNGESQQYYLNSDNQIKKLNGFYKIGIYSGQTLNFDKIENFLNGFKVENLDLNLVKTTFSIEELDQIPEDFTGFNRGVSASDSSLVINEYKNGKLIKEYSPDYYETSVKEFKEDGGYYLNIYNSLGFIQREMEVDKDEVWNGKNIEYFYYDNSCTKTVGNLVNGELSGKYMHYHGDKVVSVDTYYSNDTYKRVYYKDYENNIIEKTGTGKKVNGVWVEDKKIKK